MESIEQLILKRYKNQLKYVSDKKNNKKTNQTEQQVNSIGVVKRDNLGVKVNTKKTTNDKTQNVYKINRDKAYDSLRDSRVKYNKYIADRMRDVNNKKLQPISFTDYRKSENDFQKLVEERTSKLKEATSSKKAKKLKKDMTEKQNDYNYQNYLYNAYKAENEDVSNLDKLTDPYVSALADAFSGFKNLTGNYNYRDEEGNRIMLPSLQELKHDKVRDSYKTPVGKIYNDVTYNLSKMIPMSVMEGIVPGSGKLLYYGDILNDSVTEAKNNGLDNTRALSYGLYTTAVAGTMDKFIGTTGRILTGGAKGTGLKNAIQQGLINLTNKPKFSQYVGNMGAEGLSEFVEEFLDGIGRKFILDDDGYGDDVGDFVMTVLPDALYSGLIGSVSGGVGTAIGNVTGRNKDELQALKDYNNTLENYKPQNPTEAKLKEDMLSENEQKINNINNQMLQQSVTQQQNNQQQNNQVLQKSINNQVKNNQVKNNQVKNNQINELSSTTNKQLKTTTPKTINKKQQVSKKTLSNQRTTKVKQNPIKNKAVTEIKKAKKVNSNIDTNLLEKEVDSVITVSNKSSTKQVQKAVDMVVPTSKNKKTVDIGDGKKYIEPSKNITEKSVDDVLKVVNTISNKEKKEIDDEDKNIRQGYDSLIHKYKDNPDKVKWLENQKQNDLYEVRHVSKNMFDEKFKLLEDPEHYVNTVRNDYVEMFEGDKEISQKKLQDFQEKAQVIINYYGDKNNKDYNSAIDQEFQTIWTDIGTDIGQLMASRSVWLKNDPKQITTKVMKVKRQMFRDEAKKHENDTAWLNENDPRKNPNSKFNLTQEQFNNINYLVSKLEEIPDKKSVEYQKAKLTLDNYIQQDIYAKHSISKSFKKLTILNLLASSRIWVNNARGNLFNLAQVSIDKLPTVFADKIISTQTGLRTSGISFQGDVLSAAKGFKKGISDSFYELKHDISISKFGNKFIETDNNKSDSLGEKHETFRFNDKTKVGRALNNYSRLINFAMNVSDRSFARMYFESSLYNQRLGQARINAKKNKTNYIYKINENTKNNTYKVSYIDSDGLRHMEILDKKAYNKFIKKSKIQDITTDMVSIAEKEALENTFQDDNKVTQLALKMKGILNSVHIGDFGLGDAMLKFTKTGSNMAKMLYEHSPLEAINLFNDIKTLNSNIKKAKKTNKQINPKLQHKVARDFGKLMGGTMTTAGIAALVSTGLVDITGGEEDDKEGKFLSNTLGFQPYSIKVGKYNYSLDSGSTFGSLIKIGTDIGKTLEEGQNLLDGFLNGADTFINEMIDVSFVNNVLDLTNTQYSSIIENFTQQLASQPANLIPSFLKDISIATDNFVDRQVYDDDPIQYMFNQIINRTPFRGDKNIGLEAKRDNWGELKTVGGDVLASAFNTFYSTGLLTREKRDVVSDEIIRVYTSTNDSTALPKLSSTQSTIKYNKEDYKLSEKEQKSMLTNYAKTAHSSVKKLINTNTYKNATDEDKLKLINKAYDYANEKSKQKYIESKGKTYYNFESEDGIYTKYKKPAFEEIIENDISIDEANYKRKYNNSYKLKTSITDWNNYNDIRDDIEDIKETYSTDNGYDYKERKYAIQTYISKLSGLTSVQKAMLSKLENSKSDYTSYDDRIESYINTLDLTDEEYTYVYDQLGLGGYWGMYWREK